MSRKRLSIWCLIVLGLAACRGGWPWAVPSQPATGSAATDQAPVATSALAASTPASTVPTTLATTSTPTPSAAETSTSSQVVVVFSGKTDAVSGAFSLPAPADLKVSWQYQGPGHFAIWLVNVSDEVDDPAYDRLLVADAPGENTGQVVQHLIAGEYHVEVEEAYGPWTVTVSAPP